MGQRLSGRLERLVTFLERVVQVLYGLSPVPMEFFWGSLELRFGLLQMMDGRLYPRMMLRRRTSRGCGKSRRRRARPRRSGLRVKNYG